MNSLFTLMLVLHVLVAVLGLGSMLSIAVVALITRRAGRGPGEVLPWIASLLRLSAFSLAAMLATGIILDLGQAPNLLPIDLLAAPIAEANQLVVAQLHCSVAEHFVRNRRFAGQQIQAMQIAEQSKISVATLGK